MAGIRNNCLDWYILNSLDITSIIRVLDEDFIKDLRQYKRGEAVVLLNGNLPFHSYFNDYRDYCKQVRSIKIKDNLETFKVDTFDIKSIVKSYYNMQPSTTLDVDNLVRKIDSKIEQLEAEEKAEKEKQYKNQSRQEQ